MGTVPKLFEESTVAFECGKQLYLVPDYRIVHFELVYGKFRPPEDSIKIKRLTLNYEITHQNVSVISENHYGRYGIPEIFHNRDQLAFMTKEGIFITSDIQVILAQI